MNDLWLFLGCILFLFVLWVYSGGPNQPISFAGPYITPITAPGITQTGYGGSANASFRKVVLPSDASSNTILSSARSPYAGSVTIKSSEPRSTNPDTEFILLHLLTNTTIDVTGWQLVDADNGVHVRIPTTPSSGGYQDMVLSPSHPNAYVISGAQLTDSMLASMYPNSLSALLGAPSELWPNSSDTITLLDQNGKVVDQYQY